MLVINFILNVLCTLKITTFFKLESVMSNVEIYTRNPHVTDSSIYILQVDELLRRSEMHGITIGNHIQDGRLISTVLFLRCLAPLYFNTRPLRDTKLLSVWAITVADSLRRICFKSLFLKNTIQTVQILTTSIF